MNLEIDAMLVDDEQNELQTKNQGQVKGISRKELKNRIKNGEPIVEIPVVSDREVEKEGQEI